MCSLFRRSVALLLALGLLLPLQGQAESVPPAAFTSHIRQRNDSQKTHGRKHRPNSLSIGLPYRGALRNGVRLKESRVLRIAAEYRGTGHFYGTTELINLLEKTAAHVARRFRGPALVVGELSKEGGGPIPGHRSHQNGRDVDIAFYTQDEKGNTYLPYAFLPFDRRGHSIHPHSGFHFDDARNWELVARLVSDEEAKVQFIFVAETLKQRLLRTAKRRKAPHWVIERAQSVMVQPSHGHPHRNHFHVRIYCAPDDRPFCQDSAPFHPWYPRLPRENTLPHPPTQEDALE
ncbi:MAG: penicillin-insensitive murein endopeptidase [Sandaracinaceae bacterium]|nr:penicillin-insensitive murein endopeptidase [Sandaracinaceae bacterium]